MVAAFAATSAGFSAKYSIPDAKSAVGYFILNTYSPNLSCERAVLKRGQMTAYVSFFIRMAIASSIGFISPTGQSTYLRKRVACTIKFYWCLIA